MREKLRLQFIFAAVLLGLFILSSDFAHFASSLLKPFTEGNTASKYLLFFAFFLLMAAGKLASDYLKLRLPKSINKEKLAAAFLILIFCGFLLNLLANIAIFNFYGASANSYVAHVADCGNSTCWEATYLQHSHSLKPAIYFLDKNLNLNLEAKTDSGRPIYEITPNADIISILAIGILFLISIAAVLLAIAETKYSSFFLLTLAAIVSIIAVLDGGMLTVAGINAVVFSLIYYSHEKQISKSFFFIAMLLAYVYLIGSEVPKWLGTNLVFLDWFGPSVLVISFYILSEFPKPKLMGMKGIALLLLIYSGYFYLHYFSYVYFGDSAGPSSKVIIYGFPDNRQSDDVLLSFSSPELSSHTRYGWYAVVTPSKSIAVNNLVAQLKKQLSPSGYFLGEADAQSPRNGYFSVLIRNPQEPVEINTASFTAYSNSTCQTRCNLNGTTTLYATHLALEITSYLHSKGYDAVVISPVIWKYE